MLPVVFLEQVNNSQAFGSVVLLLVIKFYVAMSMILVIGTVGIDKTMVLTKLFACIAIGPMSVTDLMSISVLVISAYCRCFT